MDRPKELLNDAAIALLATGLALGIVLRVMEMLRPAAGIVGW